MTGKVSHQRQMTGSQCTHSQQPATMLGVSRQFTLKRKEKITARERKAGCSFVFRDTHWVSTPSRTPHLVDTVWLPNVLAGSFSASAPRFASLGSWLPRVRNLKELGGAVRDASCWRKVLLHSFKLLGLFPSL